MRHHIIMKGLLDLDMATIRSPYLTTVQEDGDTDGFVHWGTVLLKDEELASDLTCSRQQL